MFDALKRWRRRRVLGRSALPDGLWAEAAEALPFVQELDDALIPAAEAAAKLGLESCGA